MIHLILNNSAYHGVGSCDHFSDIIGASSLLCKAAEPSACDHFSGLKFGVSK